MTTTDEDEDVDRYGFRWGPMTIIRASEIPGRGYCLSVATDAGQRIDVYCSPTGRSLRVFRRGKGEMKP